jgi:DNA-binding Lrp family transcriptional regulator
MIKLDVKDRKILYELDIDARQSLQQIGKKVSLKKDVVSYRLKKLEDEGIIKNYWTAFDTFRLGYNVFRIYINFRFIVNADKKQEIIKYFTEYKNAWAVISVKGPIDFDAVLWVKDVYEFYQFWDKALEKYEDYFEKYTVSIYIQAINYKKSYLLGEEFEKNNRELYRITCGGEPAQIDELDYRLLNELAMNARIPLVDLAQKLNCSSQTINYRLQRLQKDGIIKGFHIGLDLSKLGLQNVKVDINLMEYHKKKVIIEYLTQSPHLFCLNTAVGWYDVEFEFVVENVDQIIKIMEDVDSKFPNTIRKIDYWIAKEVHKERWLPKLF